MFKKIELDNGMTLVCERMENVRSVAIGIWVNAGARHERPVKNGISHFLEHMFFKGTGKRTVQEIARDIDSLGGELNAFTSKENTAFYVRVMDECAEQGLELLADIFLNARFPDDEVQREKGVVCEEIRMVLDTPDDYIHDLFNLDVWGNEGLGQPVLGNEETVKSIERQDLLDYIENSYSVDRTVVSCAGNFDMDKLSKLLGNTLGRVSRPDIHEAGVKAEFRPHVSVYQKDLAETHICLGVSGIPQSSNERYTALLLNTVVGGGVSSRLFQEIREKRGLAYSVYSFLSSYSDNGAWGVYAGTGKENANQVIETAAKELAGISETLGSDELERAKRQVKASIMLALESSSRRMQNLANQQIYYGMFYSPQEIIMEIESVTLSDARDLARRLVSSGGTALTVLGPLEEADLSFDAPGIFGSP
jgi:predicted Zn-dependent peptidase